MILNDNVLQSGEKVIFSLREIYLSHGYKPYRMSKFEEYDLYASNKDFLVSDNVITFTDGGKLMALKPDVTLSIIKNSADTPNETQKVFYNENVYRISESTGMFKEIMQSGAECFGKVSENEICEILQLAAECLEILSPDAVISISDLDIISQIIERAGLNGDKQKALYAAIGEKNAHETDKIFGNDKKNGELIKNLMSLCGPASYVLPKLDALFKNENIKAYQSFSRVMQNLLKTRFSDMIGIDFSVIGDVNYYNGIVFNGFLRDIPVYVLSGGQYDRLMNKMGRTSCAIGFAVYTDLLERFDTSQQNEKSDEFVNVALPKGRLGEKVYELFAEIGYECPEALENSRKLIFENAEKKVRYFWVKPSDVAIYVERGAADIGVAGKDILLEYEPDVYELADLNKGKCRMAVAAPNSFSDDTSKTLRVATKFANIAKTYYRAKGRDIDIIHLNGSIEIAPILGLSDVIVDIVETGTTLRENNLCVFEEIVPISARLISNKSAFKFKNKQISEIADKLKKLAEEEK